MITKAYFAAVRTVIAPFILELEPYPSDVNIGFCALAVGRTVTEAPKQLDMLSERISEFALNAIRRIKCVVPGRGRQVQRRDPELTGNVVLTHEISAAVIHIAAT